MNKSKVKHTGLGNVFISGVYNDKRARVNLTVYAHDKEVHQFFWIRNEEDREWELKRSDFQKFNSLEDAVWFANRAKIFYSRHLPYSASIERY